MLFLVIKATLGWLLCCLNIGKLEESVNTDTRASGYCGLERTMYDRVCTFRSRESFQKEALHHLGIGFKPLRERNIRELFELAINQVPIVLIQVVPAGQTKAILYEECDRVSFERAYEAMCLAEKSGALRIGVVCIAYRRRTIHQPVPLQALTNDLTLSKQLKELTGDVWSSGRFCDAGVSGGELGGSSSGLLKHIRTGQLFMVPSVDWHGIA